jgi:hypothetical protein
MSDEDFVVGRGRVLPSDGDDVEQMLEILMKIAQSEGRDFLAYLLSMALIEARNQSRQGPISRTNPNKPGIRAAQAQSGG